MDRGKLIGTVVVSVAVVIAAHFLARGFQNRGKAEGTIDVTGLGKKDFDSDLIVWSGSFSRTAMEMKEAYAALDKDRERIKTYLIGKGIAPNELVFEAIMIEQQYDYWYDEEGNSHREFKGYRLQQNLTVETADNGGEDRLTLVETVARDVTELINEGIEFYSGSPQYYYTRIEELKVEMVAAATENATERARRIAENADSDLGELKSATMGVFQILGRNDNEEYSWGGTFNTSSRKKTAQITMKLKFSIN
jgi:hypothetical protein